MRTLLAVDGSAQSEEAVRAVAHLSQSDQLLVVHALDVPKPAYPMMTPEVAQDLYNTVEQNMREEGERLLKHVVSIFPAETGQVAMRLEMGSPAERILSIAQQERTDLIVMGTRGVGAMQEFVLGSVAHRVVTHATCPTLIVKAPLHHLRSILLAVEGANDAEVAIEFLSRKPFRHPTAIIVITVLPLAQPLWPVGVSDSQKLRENALKSAWYFVWDVAARLSGYQYQTCALVGMGAPTNAILQQAATVTPDLIMIGSHGKKGITRFLLGSVSHGVVHGASCPVLIVR
jgi:nucleotide-binding universal stress UspA family protein